MAFSDFTARQLQQKFGLRFEAQPLFAEIKTNDFINPSAWLQMSLQKAIQAGFANEKSRSERIISPVLIELAALFDYNFAVHSGCILTASEENGLIGECDFLFSKGKIIDFLTAPVFCLVEAKKQDMEQGTIQCAAQLHGAAIFNQETGEHLPVLYGCASTGTEWRFLKYTEKTITIDTVRYFLADLPQLLAILVFVVKSAQKFTNPEK